MTGNSIWLHYVTLHSDTQKSRRQTKMLEDSVTMLLQAIIMPIIWHDSCKSISTSNKDMATLIYKKWQPWNKKCGFPDYIGCFCWIKGYF